MDAVRVEDLHVRALIGVHPHEARAPQELVVNLTLFLDIRPAARDDDVSLTANYESASQIARDVLLSRHHRLIETAAERIAAAVLAGVPACEAINVRLSKPRALAHVRTVSVEIRRDRR